MFYVPVSELNFDIFDCLFTRRGAGRFKLKRDARACELGPALLVSQDVRRGVSGAVLQSRVPCAPHGAALFAGDRSAQAP